MEEDTAPTEEENIAENAENNFDPLAELDELGLALEIDEEEEGAQEIEDDDPLPPPPPEPRPEKELLFLVEFLIGTLKIYDYDKSFKDIDPCVLQEETVVELIFLNFPRIFISEKDIDPERRTGGGTIAFDSGKSLMFALKDKEFTEFPEIFLLALVKKRMPHQYKFSEIMIGKTKIELTELFGTIYDKFDENPDKVASKSVKDTYKLLGDKNEEVGEISIYVRLTYFGETIVTEFERSDYYKDVTMFKSPDSDKKYTCKETIPGEVEQLAPLHGFAKVCSQKDERPQVPITSFSSPQGSLPNAPPPSPSSPYFSYSPDSYSPESDSKKCRDDDYEEIYAEINGSVMIIELEKNKRKDPPKKFHISEFCDCDIPLPEKLVAGMSDLSVSPASMGSINLASGTPVKTDKYVGLDTHANQLTFKVPPTDVLAQPGIQNKVTYNVDTCMEGGYHKHRLGRGYKVTMNHHGEGSWPKLPNDPENDVFILRIIKRGRKELGKDNLELVLRTPKEKIVPPKRVPYMVEKLVGPEKKKDKDDKKKRRNLRK